MKRAGNLIPQIATRDNLALAFYKAAKGKRFKPEVVRFHERLEDNLSKLIEEVQEGCVAVGHYHSFTIHDPKERRIYAACFRERALHHAIMNVCEPYFERRAIYHSYACRVGKGNHAALAQARRYGKRFGFYLKLDIRKYFDSIDHAILKGQLRRIFKDPDLLRLLDRIIDSYQTLPGKGLPIGALTSQHFANFYLGFLDRFVLERLRPSGYVRFMDDFVLWGNDGAELRTFRREIEGYLRDALALELKERSPVLRTAHGVPFLGYRVFSWGLRLNNRSKKRFREKWRVLVREARSGVCTAHEARQRALALIAVTEHAKACGFRRNVLARYGEFP